MHSHIGNENDPTFWQQCGIFDNGRKPDRLMLFEGTTYKKLERCGGPADCKPISLMKYSIYDGSLEKKSRKTPCQHTR